MACLKRTIHSPGRGSQRSHAGCHDRMTYGSARPIAVAVKARNRMPSDCVNANPIAGPRNGAVHGVARTVARTP